MTRAALYTRISATDKDVNKPENQRLRLVEYAAAKGYTIVETFTDDGIGAHKPGAVRPAFYALSVAIQAGKFDIILATEQPRVGRNVEEWEPVIRLLQKAKTPYETINGGGPWDMTLAAHREYSRTQVVKASGEVETRQEHQHDRTKDELAKGAPLWGPRFFGFENGKGEFKGRVVGLNESEAAALLKASADVLDGKTAFQIASEWNAAGLLTARGGQWTSSTVKTVLTRPRNAGWLTYKDERISRTLPEIVTEEVWQNVVDTLTDRTRVVKRGPKEKAMLSGIIL